MDVVVEKWNPMLKIPPDKLVSIIKGVCDLISEGIVIIDREFNVIWVNKAIEDKGFLLKNVVGHKSFAVFDNLDNLDTESPALKTFQRGEVNIFTKTGGDGNQYRITAMPIKDESGTVIYVIEYSENITAKVKTFTRTTGGFSKFKVYNDQTMVIKTSKDNYTKHCIELLELLVQEKKMKGVIITFQTHIREIIDTLYYQKRVDISNIHIIDAVSLVSHEGIDVIENMIPLFKPDSFNDIEVYTNSFLKKIEFEESFVLFIGLHMLEHYDNVNEIGVFLEVFTTAMKENNVPDMIIIPRSTDPYLSEVISNYADQTFDMDE